MLGALGERARPCCTGTPTPSTSRRAPRSWPRREATPVQAFRAGSALGLQFHPELDAGMLDLWLATPDMVGDLSPRTRSRRSARPAPGTCPASSPRPTKMFAGVRGARAGPRMTDPTSRTVRGARAELARPVRARPRLARRPRARAGGPVRPPARPRCWSCSARSTRPARTGSRRRRARPRRAAAAALPAARPPRRADRVPRRSARAGRRRAARGRAAGGGRGGRARRVGRRGPRHPAAAARAGEQPPGHARPGLVDAPVAGRRRGPRRDGGRVPRARGRPARAREPGERRAHALGPHRPHARVHRRRHAGVGVHRASCSARMFDALGWAVPYDVHRIVSAR